MSKAKIVQQDLLKRMGKIPEAELAADVVIEYHLSDGAVLEVRPGEDHISVRKTRPGKDNEDAAVITCDASNLINVR